MSKWNLSGRVDLKQQQQQKKQHNTLQYFSALPSRQNSRCSTPQCLSSTHVMPGEGPKHSDVLSGTAAIGSLHQRATSCSGNLGPSSLLG